MILPQITCKSLIRTTVTPGDRRQICQSWFCKRLLSCQFFQEIRSAPILGSHERPSFFSPTPRRDEQPESIAEQVLTVAPAAPTIAGVSRLRPRDPAGEVLITYPVPTDRLDIYTQFLLPAGIAPGRHKAIETTDIMLQMVASQRGVAALPRWLVQDYAARLDIVPVRLGAKGIAKQIHLGAREADLDTDYLKAFVELARGSSAQGGDGGHVGR